MATISKENYLKTIFNYKANSGVNATTVKVAQDLSVSNAAISEMAKKLSEEGLISYKKYKGMELTSNGEKVALKVIRRHRLWELFLVKALGIGWNEVHGEAERLEHHTSEFLIDKIDEYLGFPDFDPHGHPIPKKNGTIPKTPKVILLSEAEKDNVYEFVRVDDRDSELINYLIRIGFLLNTELTVVDKLSFDNSVTISFNKKTLSMSNKLTKSIYVKAVKN
ncbi:MAG: metal-dependent transcriptional regulator [Bacteroidota bacterium]